MTDPGEELRQRYFAAEEARDGELMWQLIQQLTEVWPTLHWVWFDAGMLAKHRCDWAKAVEFNERALALSTVAKEEPAAWNLGIAATALADWPTARRAWRAYGLVLPDTDGPNSPIHATGYGNVPVRLNAEPRFPCQSELLLDGQRHQTEVVWCQRLSAAHVRILNVPTPDSGHHFGDIVLIDGDGVGSRDDGTRRVPVFNEITRLWRSNLVPWTVEVASSAADVEGLRQSFSELDYAAEEWASSLHVLCRTCSEGDPDPSHDHQVPESDGSRSLAIAAPRAVAEDVLIRWAAGGSMRSYGELRSA